MLCNAAFWLWQLDLHAARYCCALQQLSKHHASFRSFEKAANLADDRQNTKGARDAGFLDELFVGLFAQLTHAEDSIHAKELLSDRSARSDSTSIVVCFFAQNSRGSLQWTADIYGNTAAHFAAAQHSRSIELLQ